MTLDKSKGTTSNNQTPSSSYFILNWTFCGSLPSYLPGASSLLRPSVPCNLPGGRREGLVLPILALEVPRGERVKRKHLCQQSLQTNCNFKASITNCPKWPHSC